jgi:nucleotide-binding universal stress UspA family protein
MPGAETEPRPTIVVGVDGSDSSIGALGWACELATHIGSSVEAVTVWHWPMSLGAAIPIPSEYDPVGDAQAMLDRIVGPLVATYPSVVIRDRVVEGRPAQVLVEASEHADLLVVGSRGRGEVAGLLLGSVSQHCAAHAASTVVVHRDPAPRGSGDRGGPQ